MYTLSWQAYFTMCFLNPFDETRQGRDVDKILKIFWQINLGRKPEHLYWWLQFSERDAQCEYTDVELVLIYKI